MHWVPLLAICIAATAAMPSSSVRIVGGSPTTIERYPSMAALLHSQDGINYRQGCGGTIINNRSILTAAHCTVYDLDRPTRWRSRVGSTLSDMGGVVYYTAFIINHPNYKYTAAGDDVAIIRTATEIIFAHNVQPAPIVGVNYNLADNESVWATGWGMTVGDPRMYTNELHHVEVWTVNQETCRQLYSKSLYHYYEILDNMLCTGDLKFGGRDQCSGDSGGPVYHHGAVVGVCSFGEGCANAQFPGVNSRVSSHSSWIRTNA